MNATTFALGKVKLLAAVVQRASAPDRPPIAPGMAGAENRYIGATQRLPDTK
jgi:hypothetical protein